MIKITMATGGIRRPYKEDDKFDEYLLYQVSKWVLYHRLSSLARSLGLSHAEFSRIRYDNTTQEERIFRVSVCSRCYRIVRTYFYNKVD